MEFTQEQKLYIEPTQKAEENTLLVVDGAELSDDQLEVVSGGRSGGGCIRIDLPGDPPPTFPDTNSILY